LIICPYANKKIVFVFIFFLGVSSFKFSKLLMVNFIKNTIGVEKAAETWKLNTFIVL